MGRENTLLFEKRVVGYSTYSLPKEHILTRNYLLRGTLERGWAVSHPRTVFNFTIPIYMVFCLSILFWYAEWGVRRGSGDKPPLPNHLFGTWGIIISTVFCSPEKKPCKELYPSFKPLKNNDTINFFVEAVNQYF